MMMSVFRMSITASLAARRSARRVLKRDRAKCPSRAEPTLSVAVLPLQNQATRAGCNRPPPAHLDKTARRHIRLSSLESHAADQWSMNEQLSWLESIIIRRNLRSVELLENDEDHHGSDFTSESHCTTSLKDYLSTSGTSEVGSLFNPFDSPPLDLSEPPLLRPAIQLSLITRRKRTAAATH